MEQPTYMDPVCGMQVTPESAAAQSDYQGVTYYFCCDADRQEFDRNPENYLTQKQNTLQ
ncbi:MAG: YHS domain-containing protein [Anaerolineales bacterium]|nr:YHS domain-containing protein [Anaerolineales bacterium]